MNPGMPALRNPPGQKLGSGIHAAGQYLHLILRHSGNEDLASVTLINYQEVQCCSWIRT